MSAWYAFLDGPNDDVPNVRRYFPDFTFEEIDGVSAWSLSPEYGTNGMQIAEATDDLIAGVNVVLRLRILGYTGVRLRSLLEARDDGTKHQLIFISPAVGYAISGSPAVLTVTGAGRRKRSIDERLLSLLQREPAIADLAAIMADRPPRWSGLNTVYESVKGLASVRYRRDDHQGLVARGWISAEQANSFYDTAGYERHGYPKEVNPDVRKMPLDEAALIIEALFWRLVDHLEPE